MKKEFEIIVINWEKVPLKANQDFNNQWDYGLYSVYGNHIAYGKDSLLYIGQARDNTFTQRLFNDKRISEDFYETTQTPEYVRLGWIVKSNENNSDVDNEKWTEYIDVAESLLISSHCPSMNSQLKIKLSSIGATLNGKNYLIINKGDRGSLLPEISSINCSYEFYNYETPLNFKN
jgi:hypothetical protein